MGPGADWVLDGLPTLLGADDDASDFRVQHHALEQPARRFAHWRVCRTRLVMESLVPAIFEQRVTGKESFATWRRLLQVYGDNPGLPDEGPDPGFNLQQVPLIVFPDLAGWLLHRVEPGDTLTGIVREVRPFVRTTVAQLVAANPRITDPDHIEVGWKLRVPLRG